MVRIFGAFSHVGFPVRKGCFSSFLYEPFERFCGIKMGSGSFWPTDVWIATRCRRLKFECRQYFEILKHFCESFFFAIFSLH